MKIATNFFLLLCWLSIAAGLFDISGSLRVMSHEVKQQNEYLQAVINIYSKEIYEPSPVRTSTSKSGIIGALCGESLEREATPTKQGSE